MRLILLLSFCAIASLFAFATWNSVFARNQTVGNMSSAVNMTNAISGGNMTTSDDGGAGSAKTELEEGIKSLQGADTETARTHLTAAQEAMTGAPSNAIRHFEEGMKAFNRGDNNAAIMHLNIANEALG